MRFASSRISVKGCLFASYRICEAMKFSQLAVLLTAMVKSYLSKNQTCLHVQLKNIFRSFNLCISPQKSDPVFEVWARLTILLQLTFWKSLQAGLNVPQWVVSPWHRSLILRPRWKYNTIYGSLNESRKYVTPTLIQISFVFFWSPLCSCRGSYASQRSSTIWIEKSGFGCRLSQNLLRM